MLLQQEVAERRGVEERFRSLIETSTEAFIAMNADGLITEWNRQAEETFGWKREEVLGCRLVDIVIPPRYHDAHTRGLARYLESGEGPVLGERLELDGRRRDGSEFPVELTIWALDADPEVRFNALLHDISERRRVEAARRELDELKDAFVRTVSHDLRGPLAVIAGMAELLEDADLSLSPEGQRGIAGRIAATASRLDRLVSDLLDFDRVSHGGLGSERRATDVAEVVQGVAESVEVAGHPLHVDAEPAEAEVDRAQVERIVENLVANAARHTPSGTPIWVRVRARPDGVLIAVDDAGPGVPDALKSMIFEPYQRDPATGGAGIGLSLVARFAELHGGRAWVEDRPGGGASFRVLVPHPGPMTRKNAGERSALIVDDDADLRLTLRLTLELAAEPVHVMGEAASGEEALSRWRELHPDVVILDARLPGLSGLETARRMLSEDPEQLRRSRRRQPFRRSRPARDPLRRLEAGQRPGPAQRE